MLGGAALAALGTTKQVSLVVWLLAPVVAAIIALASVTTRGRHFLLWSSRNDGRHPWQYVVRNTVTGAVVTGVAAYPGMLLAILLFMAP